MSNGFYLQKYWATQFLSNMLFIYRFANCNIFKFLTCCSMYKWVMATLLLLLMKMWKITNISKTVKDRAILSEFLIHRVLQEYFMHRGKISIFSPLLVAILHFSGKWKSVNISKIVRDRAISSKFLTHRVVQVYPVPRGKILIFTTFCGHLGF